MNKQKLIALPATALLTVGMLGLTGGTAHAACGDYPAQCSPTDSDVNVPNTVEKGDPVTVRFEVENEASNREPKGKVTITVDQTSGAGTRAAERAGGFFWTKTLKYTGGVKKIKTPDLNKVGQYKVTIQFKPKAGSPFRASKSSDTLRVTR